MSNTLYDTDFVRWLGEQAQLLRTGDFAALDVENLAEEIENVSRSERRELFSRMEALLLRLLKWQAQQGMRCSSWSGAINGQRRRIEACSTTAPACARR